MKASDNDEMTLRKKLDKIRLAPGMHYATMLIHEDDTLCYITVYARNKTISFPKDISSEEEIEHVRNAIRCVISRTSADFKHLNITIGAEISKEARNRVSTFYTDG